MRRMIPASRFRTVLLGVALLFTSGQAAADTIVLKNGRRIIALSAVEEGDRVKYLTSAGELSLPKSIVDHIEKGGGVSMSGSPGAEAANLTIAPPERQSSGNISRNWKAQLTRAGGRPIGARRWGIIWRRISNWVTAIWSMRSSMRERN